MLHGRVYHPASVPGVRETLPWPVDRGPMLTRLRSWAVDLLMGDLETSRKNHCEFIMCHVSQKGDVWGYAVCSFFGHTRVEMCLIVLAEAIKWNEREEIDNYPEDMF